MRTDLEAHRAYLAGLRGAAALLLEAADAVDAALDAITALPPPPSPLIATRLTARQHQILGMRAREMLNKQIAYELGISERTVWNALADASHRLGLSGYQAIATYRRMLEETTDGLVVAGGPRRPGVAAAPASARQSVPA